MAKGTKSPQLRGVELKVLAEESNIPPKSFLQRLNGNTVNGKVATFTEAQRAQILEGFDRYSELVKAAKKYFEKEY